MSNSVFKKWTSAVLYLNEKIKNNSLIAGRNIQLENTGNGIRIHGSAENIPSGDTYKGYFTVIKTTSGYNVINGSDSTDYNCGYVKAGNLRLTASKTNFSAENITTDGTFYIETTYANGAYAIRIKFAEALPDAVNGKDICLIADLKDEKPIQKLFGEHNIARWV